jgi:hypothetical protein
MMEGGRNAARLLFDNLCDASVALSSHVGMVVHEGMDGS